LDKKLQSSFPLKNSFNGVNAQITSPKIVLKPLDDKLEIKVLIKLEHNKEILFATGKLTGPLTFHERDNVLHIDEPYLKDIEIVDDQMKNSNQAMRVLKQTLSRRLPPIIFVEFESLDIEFMDRTPQEIKILSRSLTIKF